MENKYQHIFFDLDRTLWDFDKNSTKVLTDIFFNFKLNELIINIETFTIKYQEVNESLWKAYANDKVTKDELRWKRFEETLTYFNINDKQLAINIGDYYIEESPRQKMLFPNTIEVLDYLSEKYQLHIITNGFKEVQYIKLTESGIINYFKEIILSEKVGVKKPHPYIFKKAYSLAGATNKNSIMIGDDLYADIYGAQRVEMDHVYFNPNKLIHTKRVQYEINNLEELYHIL